MKTLLVLLSLLISASSWEQDCDTVYSNSERVRITVEVNYSNCYYLEMDTVYYWERYTTYPLCGKLLHYQTKKLIAERWISSDTSYYLEYYPSGTIKFKSAYFQNGACLYNISFYENGSVKRQYDPITDMFYKLTHYYKNGNKHSEGYYCYSSPYPWNEYIVYYSSGQISSRRTFTAYHDSLSRSYNETTELSAVYFDEKGRKVATELNSPDQLTISVQPKWVGEDPVTQIDPITYTYEQFSDQNGYDHELLLLKNAIHKQLQFPEKCDCKKGVAWFTIIIDSNGSIDYVEVDYPNEEVKTVIEKAIKNLKKWPTAKIDNEPVRVYVYNWLPLDE